MVHNGTPITYRMEIMTIIYYSYSLIMTTPSSYITGLKRYIQFDNDDFPSYKPPLIMDYPLSSYETYLQI